MSTDLIPLDEDFGPAMRALTTKQRAFVQAMTRPTSDGKLNYLEAARTAGYGGNNESLKVSGHRLAHSPKIQAAMLEEGIKRLGAAIPVATAMLISIAQDDSLKAAQRQRAAESILDRAGIPAGFNMNIKTEKVQTEAEKVSEIISISKVLGLDPKQVLGASGYKLPDEKGVGQDDTVVDVESEVIATTEGLEDVL